MEMPPDNSQVLYSRYSITRRTPLPSLSKRHSESVPDPMFSVAKGVSRSLTVGLSEKAPCRNSYRIFIEYNLEAFLRWYLRQLTPVSR